ncbi:MAG: class I SAM-dependent methyltransferase [Desulfococcaceae bacterium]
MKSESEKEILHGVFLAENDPEKIWGWDTPAGRIRSKRRAELIIRGAGLKPGMKVLEIGCGTGFFTEMFAKSGAHILAVDISDDLLEIARKRGLPSETVSFVTARFEDCDAQGPFDAVIGSSILHHLDIKTALAKIHSLLRSGGVMCFTEPNMLNPQIMIQKNIPFIKKIMGDSPDETAFFRWSLDRLLKRKRFADIQIMPFDWLHPATAPSFIRMVGRMGKLLEKTPFIQEFAGSLFIQAKR